MRPGGKIMDDLPLRYAEMGGLPIDHSEEPIRLFKSDFLEFFTHITPQAVVIIWTPVIAWLVWRSFELAPASAALINIPLAFAIGIVVWSFAEYTLHRFVFHFHPKGERMKRLVFLFHGIHHAQPQCKTRLVMPPIVSIPLALLFYFLFSLIVGKLFSNPNWVDPMVAGFMTGYLVYDLMHYATHHFPMRWGFLKTLKRHHMQHHFKEPYLRFGVSSPAWDKVFRTLPE
jgi:sterol desaturase/sphingolipid hydroxylase (fatty acid hydroxylase superfamily)